MAVCDVRTIHFFVILVKSVFGKYILLLLIVTGGTSVSIFFLSIAVRSLLSVNHDNNSLLFIASVLFVMVSISWAMGIRSVMLADRKKLLLNAFVATIPINLLLLFQAELFLRPFVLLNFLVAYLAQRYYLDHENDESAENLIFMLVSSNEVFQVPILVLLMFLLSLLL